MLASQVSVPASSRRWSINIGPSTATVSGTEESKSELSTGGWHNVLFHFNPRRGKGRDRVRLLTNDMKADRWGLIETAVIEEDLLFNRSFELVVQVTGMLQMEYYRAFVRILLVQVLPDGFFVAVDGVFCSMFSHRKELVSDRFFRS